MSKILTFEELKPRGIPTSRRQVDRLEAEGKFPQRVHISERRVGWLATEIDAYVAAKIASRPARIRARVETVANSASVSTAKAETVSDNLIDA